ncbi:MAG TPA: exodeoxyribonuclease VII large subunit [Eoetvoesiella sp.]
MYPNNILPVNDTVLSVAQLNRQVSQLLAGHFSSIWVRGEVSNFTQAASGHWYFTIKDESAAVRAVMFRGRAQAVGFVPKAGERFEFRASVTLYEARGDYQLQVESLRRAGRGDLHEAFLRLKEKLETEGLFDAARKRPIKTMPKAVGVVTSLAAAALRDVLSALARRAPHVGIVIYPAPVQGMDSAGKITVALAAAIERNEVDTLLLVRGGGSLEDLWSFNDETLARTIAASPIPIISGVGHETDFTIADFVADLRAPTPTAAAELSCLARQACLGQVESLLTALSANQLRTIERASLRLDRAVALLVSPQQRLTQQNERLQALKNRMVRAGGSPHERESARFNLLKTRLAYAEPGINRLSRDLNGYVDRLASAGQRAMQQQRTRLAAASQTLEALSPKKILGRGYAIVRDEKGRLVKNALDLTIGDHLSLELSQGGADVKVLQPRSLL